MFQRKGAQLNRPRGADGAGDRFQCRTVGPRISDCRIARDARGESVSISLGHRLKLFPDAFVLVSEAFFEPQHLLSDHREAKVSRLDGACVYWSDCNLMDPVSFNLD